MSTDQLRALFEKNARFLNKFHINYELHRLIIPANCELCRLMQTMLYFAKVSTNQYSQYLRIKNSFVSDASICCNVIRLRELSTDAKSLMYDKIIICKIAK